MFQIRVQPQELTEICTGLRPILESETKLRNSLAERDHRRGHPDKLLWRKKMIRDIGQSQAEVVVQVESTGGAHGPPKGLGILPGQTAVWQSTEHDHVGQYSTTNTGTTLNQLRHLNGKRHCLHAAERDGKRDPERYEHEDYPEPGKCADRRPNRQT